MKDFIKKYLITIITIIYCVIFYFIFINIAKFHEAWADEAQAWLLAKDTSFLELVRAMRYEGSPFLWHLILKFSIFCGLSYEKMYYIPLIFTIIGIIFLFKNKNVPWIFKLTIPLTYFIFFQYTVVSRSYCLIFPILMMIANIYDKKEEKLIRYSILLFLLMNVSLHCTLIAGGLWAEFGHDIWKRYNIDKKIEKREIIFLTVIMILLLSTIIMIFPNSDCSYTPGIRYNFFEMIGEILYTNNNNLIINIIASILVISILILMGNKENYFKIIITIVPVFLLNLLVTCSIWHVGIIYLIILFLTIITKALKNKSVFILLLLSIIIQMYWNVVSVDYDIEYAYSAGKEASEYLKNIDNENKIISAIGFHCVSINSYFEENIFNNYSKSYYTWKNEDAKKTSIDNNLKKIHENKVDIYVVPDYNNKKTNQLIEAIENIGYTKKYFEAYMVVKGYLVERTGFYILEKMESIN